MVSASTSKKLRRGDKPRVCTRMEIMKIKAEISERTERKRKSAKPKPDFLKTNKINKPLPRLEIKTKREKMQNSSIRDER